MQPIIVLEQDESHALVLEVLRRRHPESLCSWDGNCLRMRVLARNGVESVEYVTDVQVSDLKEFLAGIYEGPYEGEEVFDLQTREGGITIFVEELSRKRYRVEYTASPNGDDHGPHFVFVLHVTRAVLDEAARQLELTLMLYPEIRGGQFTEPRASVTPSVN
jgi:hypothetical protein